MFGSHLDPFVLCPYSKMSMLEERFVRNNNREVVDPTGKELFGQAREDQSASARMKIDRFDHALRCLLRRPPLLIDQRGSVGLASRERKREREDVETLYS